MELVWATKDFVIAGHSYSGFPILLWDTMESCIPANEFVRHYLLRGVIGSKKSWPSIGRALYDYFSFLQAHKLDWYDVERGEQKSLLAAYRDYCRDEYGLARNTIRQRLHYVCKFYEFALENRWVSRLPFTYEERKVTREVGFLAHIDASGGRAKANNIMPRAHRTMPKFLSLDEVKSLIRATENPHHRMMIKLGLQTGLRRQEIATFPLAYVFDPQKSNRRERNVKILLDPNDGHGIQTKGNKPRDIFFSAGFMSDLHRYTVQVRGERATLNPNHQKSLFLNQFGESFTSDGKGFRNIVSTIGKKCGINVHPHMLRHTYATHTLVALQRNGCGIDPLVFLQRQLGHSSIQTTMVYLHLINELADSAILAYDEELNDIVEEF